MTWLRWMKRGLVGVGLAIMAAVLAGCGDAPAEWRADTVTLASPPLVAISMRRTPCPALDPAITTEARRLTPIAGFPEGEAFTAALIGSEAVKNASLARLMRAYETCRRGAAR